MRKVKKRKAAAANVPTAGGGGSEKCQEGQTALLASEACCSKKKGQVTDLALLPLTITLVTLSAQQESGTGGSQVHAVREVHGRAEDHKAGKGAPVELQPVNSPPCCTPRKHDFASPGACVLSGRSARSRGNVQLLLSILQIFLGRFDITTKRLIFLPLFKV